MTTKPIRLGIDFGTTRTVVAAPDDGNYPVCTFSWKGEFKTYIPSLIGVSKGRLRFGWDAERLLSRREASVLRSVKRLLGQSHPDSIVDLGQGVTLPLLELITGFLVYVRRSILRQSNLSLKPDTPLEVMVAVPANANSNQRYMTLEAFRRAGFRVIGALNEPSAAAIEFLQRYLKYLSPRSPKKFVVIYDLGGGTFDTSVVGIIDRGHEVMAHEGIARLGGDDFDQVIFDMTLERCGISASDLGPAATVRLLEECRERKEGLNFNTRKMVVDPSSAIEEAEPVMIETQQLYERCAPLIHDSVGTVQSLLERLEQEERGPARGPGLASVYLVGGSVAFPPVARTLREVYGIKVKTAPLPHASTAIGLAMATDSRRAHINETVSRHFGIWREHGRDKIFDPIFHKTHGVDPETGKLTITRRYHPMHNVGLLRYLECSSLGAGGEPAGDITVWKDIFFPYDPALADTPNLAATRIRPRPDLSHQEVREIYRYDLQGIVQIEIENCTAGYRRRFRLEPGSRSA
jgi:molecular chaperone DnaK (HSP70)